MPVFTAAPYEDVLGLITQVSVLLFTARIFGEIFQRFGQPSVIGEILAGVFWGPSFLGRMIPDLIGFALPATKIQGHLLEVVGLFGAMFLLLITGIETDLLLVRRLAKFALGTALGGIVLPFATGFILGQYVIPDYLLADPNRRLIFTLFIATAMSISAIPVISRVLIDMRLMRRDLGQSIIAAGMIDDTVGWILLSLVTGLASGQEISLMSVLTPLAIITGFIIFSFTIGKWCIETIFGFVQDEIKSQDKFLTLVVGLAFLWGSLSKSLHFEPLLGVFIVGIIIGEIPRFRYEVGPKLESMAMGVFSPIFFAIAGLKVNIYNLLTLDYIIITFVVIAVACFGKIVGAYLGARYIGGRDHWTALGFGAALNARGAMEIIVATIGLSLGILSQEMFSIVVIMALATSVMAPFLLQYILKHLEPVDEELKRLEKEELLGESHIANMHRILLPMREPKLDHLTDLQTLKFKLLERIANHKKIALTVLHVNPLISEKPDSKKSLDLLSRHNWNNLEPTFKVSKSKITDISSAILDEAEKGYDLIALGSISKDQSSEASSSIINEVVRLSPCPTFLVYADKVAADWKPKNILVAVNTSPSSKNAAELAFTIADETDRVLLLNVVTGSNTSWFQNFHEYAATRQTEVAINVLKSLKQLAPMYNVHVDDMIEIGHDVESTILRTAAKEEIDLIVLGTPIKSGSGRLFLGSRIEYIIKNASCPVVVLHS